MAAGAQAALPEEAKAISSAKQDVHRELSEEPPGNLLLFLGGESRRQLSLLLSPPAAEQSKSPKP